MLTEIPMLNDSKQHGRYGKLLLTNRDVAKTTAFQIFKCIGKHQLHACVYNVWISCYFRDDTQIFRWMYCRPFFLIYARLDSAVIFDATADDDESEEYEMMTALLLIMIGGRKKRHQGRLM